MIRHSFKRLIALLLVLTLCLPYLAGPVSVEESNQTGIRSIVESEPDLREADPAEAGLEDAAVQLGERNGPTPEPTEKLPSETAAPETEAELPAEENGAEAAPMLPAVNPAPAHRDGSVPNEGRSAADQQVLTVDGTDFILIGTKQQLQALDFYPEPVLGNANADTLTENGRYDVMGPIWRIRETRRTLLSDWQTADDPAAVLVYPGDTELIGTFADYELYGKNGRIVVPSGVTAPGDGKAINDTEEIDSYTRYHYVGGTLSDYDDSVTGYSYGKYSPRSNFVVFRDIDLEGENWTPLMFYGLMYGVKGSELDVTLETAVRAIRTSEDYDDYADLIQPTISNVSVNTALESRYNSEPEDRTVLIPDKYVGVGFFATVTSARPGTDSGFTNIKAEVRNLKLEDVTVTNGYTSIYINETLVNWLTENLGTGVGYLLDGLLRILTGKNGSDFKNSLSDLLTARAQDPTNLATGGFVGRVYGDVLIENCDVETVQIHSDHSYVGGFVGYSAGEEQYDFVSDFLGGVLSVLGTTLNLIPGLGLGDLISIVRNVLPLNTLIPVDYLNPHIEDSDVIDLSGSIGPQTLSWTFNGNPENAVCNGGFIGCKIATVMINCGVYDSSYTVHAKTYGGGFAGLTRDAVIQELLTDLGVNLGAMQTLLKNLMDSNIDLQSVQIRCSILNSDVIVTGGNYLGGFNGAMTNAYSVNNRMLSQGRTLRVTGTGDCVGGYAGIATLGWAMSVGQGDQGYGTVSLLSTLKNVLTSLLSSYGDDLLSLLGVGQSEILGLQFDYSQAGEGGSYTGGEAMVEGHDEVGGLVGRADALIMTGTTAASLSEMTYFQNGDLTVWDIFPDMPKNSAYTVTYHEKDGTTDTQTVTGAENYMISLPSRSDDTTNGYSFVGWITTHCDHVTGEPEDILYPGDAYLVTRDVTLNALYAKQGETVYELITDTPANWETAYENYIITYGRDENMVVLTGLDVTGWSTHTNYENAGSGGAKTIAQIRANGGDNTLFTHSGGLISNVPDLYLFSAEKMATQDDYYFANVQYGTLLRADASGGLQAFRTKAITTQWHPRAGDYLNVDFESDNTAMGSRIYLVYDAANGYFRMGTAADSHDGAVRMHMWGKTTLPTRYTTVDVGVETPSADTEISFGEYDIGVYAQIHVNGLRQVKGRRFVGGLAGLAGTANVGGLLNDTIGIGDFKKFIFNDITAVGGTAYEDESGNDGLTVLGTVADSASDAGAGWYIGGGIGLAIGGDLYRVDLSRLNKVEGVSCVGGFAGCVGPGELLGTGGLNLSLLGLNLLSANNLLAVGQGIETNVRNVTVTGIPAGFTVEATGANAAGENRVYCAGGFFGRSNSTSAEDCRAVRVQWVKANNTDGRAGGFLGVSEVGSLASMDDAEGTQIKGLIEAGSLLNAVGYLIPNYTEVDVRFINAGYVEAAWAGGFAADFQSGTVDNSAKTAGDRYAVYNIDHVTGTRYGGGFGAKVCSGALADAAGGVSILGGLTNVSISVTDLLSLVNAYVPTIRSAGVKSDLTTKYPARPGAASAADTNNGFLVTVTGVGEDAASGAAGGFLGYASGVQVSDSDVTLLRHTEVTPPANLEQENGDSYFGDDSAYAVTSTRYAGGFVGFLDVGSAASLGGGLNILGNSIRVGDVLGALNVVVSTVEHSDVYGAPGGFAVKSSCSVEGSAAEGGGLAGRSGGFAGWMRGGHMQDSSSYNFSYIIGQIAAGGYAGEIEPGSLADVLGSTEILEGLVSVSGGLLSIAQDLVPSIRNSVTTCIPCGGAVRANAASDAETRRGMAGGYVGHNCGGQIWGNDNRPWKNENREIDNVTTYVGDQQECAAIRVLSVYGYEYAGGFTGLMDAGSTAGSGNVSLLFDLVKLSGLLDALKVSYPTEENTAVYGPLAQMDVETWNTWVDYVGQFGGYGLSMTHVSSRTELDGILGNYLYGYHVAAGRSAYQNVAGISDSGCAGGYVGSMRSGCITNGQAYNAKQISAMRSAGGYAGEMKTGSVANLGQAEALGLSLDLSQLLTGALDVFVPVVKTSTVHGYQSGLTVAATGEQQNGCGNAGGFAGIARGAQIWGDDSDSDQPNTGCNVFCLKKVQGTRYVGGYIGLLSSGAVAEAGTNVTDGPVQELLDAVVKSGSDNVSGLLKLAGATVSTVRKASITVADPAWGFTVERFGSSIPLCAGGFVGSMEGAIVGNNRDQSVTATNIEIHDLRGVEAQYYAGGFFGVAGVGGAASVAGSGANILSLISLDEVSALDIFRPYVFNANVSGVGEGFTVRTVGEERTGVMGSTRYSGCAGGFGGALLDGTVKNAQVTNLSTVQAMNYGGGFIGHSGKSGLADVDGAKLSQLLDLNAGVGDAFGSDIKKSAVSGIARGYIVRAQGGHETVAGGFVGYADLAKIGVKAALTDSEAESALGCAATNLKLVQSEQIAGGFVGKTTKGFLVELQAGSPVVAALLYVVNELVKMLYLDEIQSINLLGLDLGAASLDVAKDGNLLRVNLLGINISVSLGAKETEGGATDVAKITIGDSYVEPTAGT